MEDHLGTRSGLVLEITEEFIRIEEIIGNGQGGYTERENCLYRKDPPGSE